MNVMRATHILPLLLLAGCVLQPIEFDDPTGTTPTENTPREIFDHEVAPLLATHCTVCHSVGSATGIDLTYEAIVASPWLNGNFMPSQAAILLKGNHEGPAWSQDQAAEIVRWLDAEAAARDQ
jgi:mono/diheme cytochrome c family protein